MNILWRSFQRLAYSSGLYPSIWQLPNPLKIHEFLELARPVATRSGQRILDLGCGSGIQAQLLARAGAHVLGVDPGEKYIRNGIRNLKNSRVSHRVQLVHGTIEELDIAEEALDKVFSFCVMEHIPNLGTVLAMLSKMLKPGGELHTTLDCLGNLQDTKARERHRQLYKVCRYFDLSDVDDVFAPAGFELLEKRYIQRSQWCASELVRQINGGPALWSHLSRRSGMRELRSAEADTPESQPGLMVLCRWRKKQN